VRVQYGAIVEWEVWERDDRRRVSVHRDRVEALAAVLVREPGSRELTGPPGPACATNRDLYARLVEAGDDMNAAGRTLAEFLRSWWQVGRSLADRAELDLDTVAAMVTAAATAEPPPMSPEWRTASYPLTSEPTSYGDWEKVVLSQIADLADFADAGSLDRFAYFGVDVSRPPDVVRATDARWYNFDPRGYLECGMAGSLGGWDSSDGLRTPVPGPVVPLKPEPEPGERPLGVLSWTDLADLAICGQTYE
jgi:hypothetical protein